MPRIFSLVGLVASAGLVLATVAPAEAAPTDPTAPDTPATGSALPGYTADGEDPVPQAIGLVVTAEDGSQVSVGKARTTVEAQGVEATPEATVVEEGVSAVGFTEPIPLDEAEEIADEVSDLPGVASVEPDLLVKAAAAPVLNDTYWSQQWNIRGTYGSHAYAAWPATTGKVVVGVVDTGRTTHPDLAGKQVAGYDFISNRAVARDGNGRDRNPHDEGDWITGSEGCGAASPSSWHGTHVAGIIGARAKNGQGIAGNAPGVRIQHLRVLGRCGGSMSDMAAAITWGSGGKVSGIARNRTRAKVINLSLAGRSDYCPATLRRAISGARKRGTVVVVAAGNENMNASLFSPANCPGVVTVAATNRAGQVASATDGWSWFPYSNFGAAVDLAAGGGDLVQGNAVLSTVNAGAKKAGAPAWAEQAGTSQAAPAVAAAAALIASHGSYSAATIEKALRWSVRGFPAAAPGRVACRPATCGTGILDLSRLPLSTKAPMVKGTPRRGQVLRATRGTWTASPSMYHFRWQRNGKQIKGGYGSTYRLTAVDSGAKIRVQVAARKGSSAPLLWRSSASRVPPKLKTSVRLSVKPKKARFGRTRPRLVAKVRVPVGRIKGKVVFRDGKKKLKTVKVGKKGRASVRLSKKRLSRGKHKITVTYVPKGPAFKSSRSKKVVVRVR